MSTDFTKIQMASSASSNKVLKQGSGSFTVSSLPGAGETFNYAQIPHGFNSDDLLVQVSTNGGPTSGTVLPWESSDGRVFQYTELDDTNLYIVVISSDISGFGAPSYSIDYFYRILIP